MKKTLSILGQLLLFLLFLALDFVGSIFYHPFLVQSALSPINLEQRSFVWDGLILMAIAYLIVLLMEALLKCLRTAAPWSTLALLLAALAGYLMKFGFITR